VQSECEAMLKSQRQVLVKVHNYRRFLPGNTHLIHKMKKGAKASLHLWTRPSQALSLEMSCPSHDGVMCVCRYFLVHVSNMVSMFFELIQIDQSSPKSIMIT
jgi:hypothetical protein